MSRLIRIVEEIQRVETDVKRAPPETCKWVWRKDIHFLMSSCLREGPSRADDSSKLWIITFSWRFSFSFDSEASKKAICATESSDFEVDVDGG